MSEIEPLKLMMIIKETPLFKEASNDEIEQIIEMSEIKEYSSGEKIVNENDSEGALYIIIDGVVSIKKMFDEEVEITRFKKSDFFGEISLFDQKPQPTSAIALESVNLLEIPYPSLRGLMVINKRLAHNIYIAVLRLQSQLLRESNERMREFLEDVLSE
jgi:CRP-like cAMP-binding protein